MKRISHTQARALRERAGKRLIDLAMAANVAPATVRSFELGGICRPAIHDRLQTAYNELRKPEPVR